MAEHAEIAARLAAATPGPWWSAIDKLAHKRGRKPMNGVVGVGEGAEAKPLAVLSGLPAKQRHPDADFIAHAPSDIAFLLNENRGLREAAHVGAELDNHHNAAMCPYCQAPLATAKDEITRLDAELALERARNRNAGKDYAEQSELLAAAEAEVATLREAAEAVDQEWIARGDGGCSTKLRLALHTALATPTCNESGDDKTGWMNTWEVPGEELPAALSPDEAAGE